MKQSIKVGKLRIFVEIFKALNWTLGELKNYRWRLNLYIILLIFQSLYEIFLTSRIGNIVDLALEDDIQKLAVTVIYFIFLYVLNISISILSNRVSAYNYNGMYNDLELKVYRKIMDSSWEELTDYHSGDLITRLSPRSCVPSVASGKAERRPPLTPPRSALPLCSAKNSGGEEITHCPGYRLREPGRS
jgi:ABC-type multidrug transport system fused ATPase/permease subunit